MAIPYTPQIFKTENDRRDLEILKYVECYKQPTYRMGVTRKRLAENVLSSLACKRESYLDVGFGRGEMLSFAKSLGFKEVIGVESFIDHRGMGELSNEDITLLSGSAHDLPINDKSVEVSSLFDVIEHLIVGDEVWACKELLRVTKSYIIITANNKPSMLNGVNLHINIRDYNSWDRLFRRVFKDCKNVEWLNLPNGTSETWLITL